MFKWFKRLIEMHNQEYELRLIDAEIDKYIELKDELLAQHRLVITLIDRYKKKYNYDLSLEDEMVGKKGGVE